ncbi:MAG: ABC transporter substrate-binding protein [Vulcanimicrobiaceae bacterium]
MNIRKCLPVLALATAAIAFATVSPSRAAQTPKPGGTFVFAIGNDPESLNPAITTGVAALAVDCKMFNGLLWVDRQNKEHPELATTWTVAKDGMAYTFRLRHDVKWHDGQPFTAADVQFTFWNVLRLYHPRSRVVFENVADVTAPDPYTVVLKMKKPYAPLLDDMTCQDAPILPKHLYAGTDILQNPHNSNDPVGTGPWQFVSWTRGDRVEMKRNPGYFRKGLPYFDSVIAKIVPDPVSRIQSLQTGEIDYVQSFFLPKTQVAPLKADKRIQLKYDTDVPGNYLMFFNVARKPLDDERVRQALLRALDRKQILDQAFSGIGYVGKSAIHQKLPFYDPAVDLTKLYSYNPTEAGKELDALGLPSKGGMRFTLHLLYDVHQAGFTAIAQIIRDNYRKIGVDVVLEPYETQVFDDFMYTKRDFDIGLQAYTTGGDPAIGIARAYITTPPGKPFTNPTNFSDPNVDKLFEEAASTVDVAVRKKDYDALQVLLAKALPLVPLIDRTEVDAAQANLRDLWQSRQPYDEWDGVWRASP